MLKKLFGKKKSEYSHFDLDKHPIDSAELDYWKIIEVSNEGMRLVLRLRIEKPRLPDIDKYSNCVTIGWKYNAVEDGLPSAADKLTHDDFEDAMDQLTMYNNLSFLMGVSTGLGEKEWVFYTKDTDEFVLILNECLAKSPKYPIDVNYYEDDAWSVWQEKLVFYQNSGQS